MKIKNNTNDIVEIKYYDIYSAGAAHSICIRPNATCEVDATEGIILAPNVLKNLEESGTIEVLRGNHETPEKVVIVEENLEESDTVESLVESDEESAPGETPVDTSETASFVCELCGKEFASARGLSSHMRSHND